MELGRQSPAGLPVRIGRRGYKDALENEANLQNRTKAGGGHREVWG